jgi:hypothetical protein
MTITANQQEKLNALEGQKLEFKTSAFYAPGSHNPSLKQMRTIAETVAAFMNAEGGVLVIGVADDGTVKGLAEELDVLGLMSSSVVLKLPQMDDSSFEYKATYDHYQLKLQHVFQAFLSPNHAGLYSISFVKTPQTKTLCCKIDVKKCAEDDFVYCSVKYAADRPAVDEIFVRIGNEKKSLQGRARDEFVEKRVKAGFDSQLKTLRDSMSMAGTQGTKAVLASVRELLAKIDGQHIPGAAITVSGGQPFTEASVTAAKKPKSLAWEGRHYAEVSGWQDLVLKVFEKLQEINAAKFDELAGQKEFKKYLVTIHKPKEKHPECYTTKFGAEGKVKIKKSLGNKVYLWQEDKALRKIIAAFGVDASKFMFVPE